MNDLQGLMHSSSEEELQDMKKETGKNAKVLVKVSKILSLQKDLYLLIDIKKMLTNY